VHLAILLYLHTSVLALKYQIENHLVQCLNHHPTLDQLISQYEKEYLGFYVSQHPVDKMFVAKQYLTIFKLSNAQNNKPILVQFDI
jgi:DNA polymerase III alpha subunit